MAGIIDTVKNALPQPVIKALKKVVRRYRNRPITPYIMKKNIEGVAFDFWICDRVGREWYDPKSPDPVWIEFRFVKEHMLREGDVVLECGGHHGCTGILMSNWVGAGGKVVTFEASPKNCDIIEKNFQLNGLKNVTLERKAVGAERGTITINDSSNSEVTLSGEGEQVELTCLDEYAHLHPTFIKIDVEGFEKQVLQGAQKILSTLPKLAIEVHTEQLAQYGASVQDLFRLIGVERYKVWIQWDEGKEPVEYDMTTPIEKRVHLFCLPLARGSV